MELSILYAIPHTGWLDMFFLGLTKIVGSYAQIWLIVGLVLLIFKKTRKTGAATAIFLNYRKAGILALVIAALIAFSRLYLFMHFPTDVLFGIIFGIITGYAAVKLSERIFNIKRSV